jgi:hypothetical protein
MAASGEHDDWMRRRSTHDNHDVFQVDSLPTTQRTALLAAFGMAEATELPDRFLIALGVLEAIS